MAGCSRAVGAAEILDPGLEKHHLTAAFFSKGKVLVKQMPTSFPLPNYQSPDYGSLQKVLTLMSISKDNSKMR